MRQETATGSDADGLTAQPAATGALNFFFCLGSFGLGVFEEPWTRCIEPAKRETCGSVRDASAVSPQGGAHLFRKNEEVPRRPFRRQRMRGQQKGSDDGSLRICTANSIERSLLVCRRRSH